MKVGDLVKIIRYGSRHAPNGSVGLIIEEIENDDPFKRHTAYHIHCNNGYIARQADFCLEIISASR